MIVDFAHNEAGIAAILDVAEGIAGGAAGRATPITVIIGTAGDRPDDTLRGIGRIERSGHRRRPHLGRFRAGNLFLVNHQESRHEHQDPDRADN